MDFEMNGYCLAEDDVGLKIAMDYNAKFFYLDGDELRFDQCSLGEKIRNNEIARAVSDIESGKQFAFYDLNISEAERRILAEVKITEFNNIIINSVGGAGLKAKVQEAIHKMEGAEVTKDGEIVIAELITRITSTIIGFSEAQEFELTVQTRESYLNEDGCIYWHLDKSQDEKEDKEDDRGDKRFLMAVKGSGTIYQSIEDNTRAEFLKVATETKHYYGHGLDGCISDDPILKVLSGGSIVRTNEGFGSLHIAGRCGAMHAAPIEAEDGRILILITPISQDRSLINKST